MAGTIFERMSALADPMRGRVLGVLERHELTVTELCAVFQLAQSTMSRHLKALADEGWLVSRAEGTSRRYAMPAARLEPRARRLWELVREQLAETRGGEQDLQRLESVLAQRKTKSREFFSTAGGEWDRVRGELFGRSAGVEALPGLLDEAWTVGDLGCGTGQVSESLARFVARVVAVDDSAAMLDAARERLGGVGNVDLRRGELERLPIGDAELDAAVIVLVLHYVPEPERSLAEVARVLKPGGRVLVVDMTPHDREEYRQAMGHLWLGFAPEQLQRWFAEAGLEGFRYTRLPVDPDARGPILFAATAWKEWTIGRGQQRGPGDRHPSRSG